MKELTKAEEQIMHIVWSEESISVKDIIERMSTPKPATNTVSTVVRILEKKGFVNHKPHGRGYLYFATIEKKDYTKRYLGSIVGNYFGNSFKDMVSFFARENSVDINDLEEMLNDIKEDLKKEESDKKENSTIK